MYHLDIHVRFGVASTLYLLSLPFIVRIRVAVLIAFVVGRGSIVMNDIMGEFKSLVFFIRSHFLNLMHQQGF